MRDYETHASRITLHESMQTATLPIGSLLLIFMTALVFSVLATPLVKRLAHRYGVLDAPSARKIHSNPVPLLGGAAIWAAVIAGLAFFGNLAYVAQTASILVGATLMSVLG